jgi:nanoRNase/pAp phosphatase (c-di-AMP/oligoRNAs hydrolase)
MDQNAKQQIIDRLKDANNVLVTVSANPSVDQLAACIGFTLLLNKLGKHATAVFSGEVPSTIEFLKPEDTIETDTNSLRDFIIALDKSKADKLRYKVEDQVVKIFITPYRTSLTEKDLEFSQGDFNVDAVIGLGVREREDLDQAIMAHGRILHDATVISINNQDQGNLGTINWVDLTVSSLSEMMVELTDGLGKDKIDGQMATAFLTGIVAQTDRFSNEKTSPQTMSIAAELMQAGANQQLIANELDTPATPVSTGKKGASKDKTTADASKEAKVDDGSLVISHKDAEDDADDAPSDELPPVADEPSKDDEHVSSGGSSKHTLAPLDLPELDAGADTVTEADLPELPSLPAEPTITSTPFGATPSSPASDIELPPTPSNPFAALGKAEDRTPTQSEDATRLDDISVTEASKVGKMSANTEPEHLQSEPSTDPLSMPMPTNQPTLNRGPVTFDNPLSAASPAPSLTPSPASFPVATPTNAPDPYNLDSIKKEADSLLATDPFNPTSTSAPLDAGGVPIGGETVEEAREAVHAAIQTNPNQALEPLVAMGSQPVNLDLGHAPVTDDPTAENVPDLDAPIPAPTAFPPYTAPAAPSMAFSMPQPTAAPGVNPNFPAGMNLPSSLTPSTPPTDTTGVSDFPSSPPPVPPPLLPPAPTP